MKNKFKKVLVFGGDGMAGGMLVDFLQEQTQHSVVFTSRRKNTKGIRFDVVSDIRSVKNIIDDYSPDYVVNCIGVLNQAAEDNKKDAVLINSYFPHELNSHASVGTYKLIHISTDCVFSGSKGDYLATDSPDEQSFYGRSKALGEIVKGNSVTLRTSIVGPDKNENGIGLLNWFLKTASQENHRIFGYANVYWSGITTLELAKIITRDFIDADNNITGLVHAVSGEKISKFDLLNLFNTSFEKHLNIIPKKTTFSDKSLQVSNKEISKLIPTYAIMVDEIAKWVSAHPTLYPSFYYNGISNE